ncbi:MAG: hypothetical protein AAGD17_09970 [Bacteroidota bacterium]
MIYSKNIFPLFALLTTFSVFGQIAQGDQGNLNDITFFLRVNNPRYEGAEGSRYLFEKFVPAKINEVPKSYPVRFDVVDNVIEFQENGEQIKGLSPKQEYRIQLMDGSNRVFITRTYIDDLGNLQKSFFELAHESESFHLFKKERIKYQPAKPIKSSYEPAKPAKFIKQEDLVYVDYPNDRLDYLIMIPKKKKKLKVFFGAQYPELENPIVT